MKVNAMQTLSPTFIELEHSKRWPCEPPLKADQSICFRLYAKCLTEMKPFERLRVKHFEYEK